MQDTDLKERVTGLEQFMMKLAYESIKTSMAVRQLFQEMKDFKEEIRQDTEKLKKEMNKKWGELANKMGTIVEDFVAPDLKGVAAQYFGIKEFDFFAPRLRLKNSERSITREFDVIAETNGYFFVVETKSPPSTGFISDFIKLIPQLDSWFPVIREKKLVPIFASLYISADLTTYLTRNNILTMATREDGMDIVNTKILKAFEAGVVVK